MTTRAIGKPVEWRLLDGVFHLPPGTVDLFIQRFRVTAQVGHEVTGMGLGDQPFGLVQPRLCPPRDPVIATDPQNITHPVTFTPRHPLVPAEARIPAEQDLHLGPLLPEPLDQQRQNSPSVFRRIRVTAPQITDPQRVPAKDLKGKETMRPIIPMIMPSDRVPRHPVIRGIKVQDQLTRRLFE